MMAFAEVIEQEWDKHGIKKIEFKRHTNSPHSPGRVTSHPAKNFLQGTLFDVFCMLYVDDGASAFISRHDLEIGARLVFETFEKFGLQMRQDGSFTIKTTMHLRHNHNLPTWVMFADLVKAFDTSNHILMIKILEKYGCPPKL